MSSIMYTLILLLAVHTSESARISVDTMESGLQVGSTKQKNNQTAMLASDSEFDWCDFTGNIGKPIKEQRCYYCLVENRMNFKDCITKHGAYCEDGYKELKGFAADYAGFCRRCERAVAMINEKC